MSRWQDCHGDEDELENDRYEEQVLRDERRAEEKAEEEWEDRQRENQKLQSMFIGDQCGYLAATAQAVIDAGNYRQLTSDEKECWVYENTKDAAIRPVNFGEI
jgi:hypothetical protein